MVCAEGRPVPRVLDPGVAGRRQYTGGRIHRCGNGRIPRLRATNRRNRRLSGQQPTRATGCARRADSPCSRREATIRAGYAETAPSTVGAATDGAGSARLRPGGGSPRLSRAMSTRAGFVRTARLIAGAGTPSETSKVRTDPSRLCSRAAPVAAGCGPVAGWPAGASVAKAGTLPTHRSPLSQSASSMPAASVPEERSGAGDGTTTARRMHQTESSPR